MFFYETRCIWQLTGAKQFGYLDSSNQQGQGEVGTSPNVV